jgi:hypothetical protein
MKHLIIALFVIFSGCRPCEPETYDMGKLSDEALAHIPYQSGDQVTLQHSAGHKINFQVTRTTTQKEEHLCGHCCDIYLFEENQTILTPDYPIFPITVTISNMDSVVHAFGVWMNGASFSIPTTDFQFEYYHQADSLIIGKSTYYDVFLLKDELDYYQYSQENPIRVDSLYYNYSQGILKITMSNDEYYQIEN